MAVIPPGADPGQMDTAVSLRHLSAVGTARRTLSREHCP